MQSCWNKVSSLANFALGESWRYRRYSYSITYKENVALQMHRMQQCTLMCLRYNNFVEDWHHVSKCEYNSKKEDFLLKFKKRLSEIEEFQIKSFIILKNFECVINVQWFHRFHFKGDIGHKGLRNSQIATFLWLRIIFPMAFFIEVLPYKH